MKGEIVKGSRYGYEVSWLFVLKPENEMETLSLKYLGSRPPNNYAAYIEGLGEFIPVDVDLSKKIKAELMHEAKRGGG